MVVRPSPATELQSSQIAASSREGPSRRACRLPSVESRATFAITSAPRRQSNLRRWIPFFLDPLGCALDPPYSQWRV